MTPARRTRTFVVLTARAAALALFVAAAAVVAPSGTFNTSAATAHAPVPVRAVSPFGPAGRLAPAAGGVSGLPSGSVGSESLHGSHPVTTGEYAGDLRALSHAAPHQRPQRPESDEAPVIDAQPGRALAPQRTAVTRAPAVLRSFDGLDKTVGSGTPPDPNGDVGPTHIIEVVNTYIGIYSKATGTLVTGTSFDALMSAAGLNGACGTLNQGDPYVVYDRVSDRWIITDFAFGLDLTNSPVGPYYECIAVSKTSSPVSGGWWAYQVLVSNNYMNDYPKFGIGADGLYMTVNLFGPSGFYGVEFDAFNRAKLIDGTLDNTQSSNQFWRDTSGYTYSVLPANDESATQTNGTPELFVSDANSLQLWTMHPDWVTPANATLNGPVNVTGSAAYFMADTTSVPQKRTTVRLDTLGDRLMSAAQWSNASGTPALWISRTVVGSSKNTAVYWAELRGLDGSPSVYQQGIYEPNTSYRWMPTLAVDKRGNMAVAYSVGNSSSFPSLAYAARSVSAATGTLNFGETSIATGLGAGTRWTRWGDYFSMSVDPVNDCTLWFVGETMQSSNWDNWRTSIASIEVPGCAALAANSAAPAVSGTAKVGETISADTGTWSGSPSFSYAWYRCTQAGSGPVDTMPNDCTAIRRATAATFTLSDATLAGAYVRALVTATNTAGSASFASAAVGPITSAPVNSAAPTISGNAAIGTPLSSNSGTWSGYPTPITYAYAWYRCTANGSSSATLPANCTTNLGVALATYTPVIADYGSFVRVVVTALNDAGSATMVSKATAAVAGQVPQLQADPVIDTAAPIVGSTANVSTGTWSAYPTPITYSYAWYACTSTGGASATLPATCTAIRRGTSASYTPTSAQVGKYLRVKITAKNAAGSASTVTAATSTAVAR